MTEGHAKSSIDCTLLLFKIKIPIFEVSNFTNVRPT